MQRPPRPERPASPWSAESGYATNRDSAYLEPSLDGSRIELLPPSSPDSTLNRSAPAPTPKMKPKRKQKIGWPWCLKGESWTVKCWINFLILVIFSLILLIILLTTYNTHKSEICLTPACVQAASDMIQAMNDSVNPCEDFYEYACGGWRSRHVIPDDIGKYSLFRKIWDQVQFKLKDLLEKPIAQNEIAPIKNIKRLYQSCMNEFSLEHFGVTPLMHYLDGLGSWPLLNANWTEDQFDMTNVLATLARQDVPVMIQMRVGSDIRQSNLSIIHLDQAALGLPSPMYYGSNNSAFLAYYYLAINISIELGADPQVAAQDVMEVMMFETKLAQILVPDQERRNLEKVYHKMTVADLSRNVTEHIDWLRYLNLVFKQVKVIEEDREVGLFVPEYFIKLGKLLNSTSPRVISNYIFGRAVGAKLAFLPQKFIEMRKPLLRVLLGTSAEKSRWKQCIALVNDNMGMVSGRLFVEKHFDQTAKVKAGEMINDLRAAFNDLLKEVTWMNDETRKVAMEKADKVRESIGYPDFILDDAKLLDAYQGLYMSNSTLLMNVIDLSTWTIIASLHNLDKKMETNSWSKSPAVVNAFYSASRNLIMFPAGILQPPFYHRDYPGYMNYGSMGMVIGHEITHGFDDKGRTFDKDGNMVQWWSDDVIAKFQERAQCIIDQYGNYTLKEIDLQINGIQTQGENIADNGGLKQAYRAYQKFIRKRGHEEARLPGLELSPNQLFFLSFAQIWCQNSRPENLIKSIFSERHSPDRYRVIGSLVNSKDFSKIYKCPRGSPMNPEHKCLVW